MCAGTSMDEYTTTNPFVTTEEYSTDNPFAPQQDEFTSVNPFEKVTTKSLLQAAAPVRQPEQVTFPFPAGTDVSQLNTNIVPEANRVNNPVESSQPQLVQAPPPQIVPSIPGIGAGLYSSTSHFWDTFQKVGSYTAQLLDKVGSASLSDEDKQTTLEDAWSKNVTPFFEQKKIETLNAANWYRNQMDKKRGAEFAANYVYNVLAEAPGAIAEFSLSPIYHGIVGAADAKAQGRDEVTGFIEGAFSNKATKEIFGAFHPLAKTLSVPLSSMVAAVETYFKTGGDIDATVKSAVDMGILAAVTPSGAKGVRDVAKDFKNSFLAEHPDLKLSESQAQSFERFLKENLFNRVAQTSSDVATAADAVEQARRGVEVNKLEQAGDVTTLPLSAEKGNLGEFSQGLKSLFEQIIGGEKLAERTDKFNEETKAQAAKLADELVQKFNESRFGSENLFEKDQTFAADVGKDREFLAERGLIPGELTKEDIATRLAAAKAEGDAKRASEGLSAIQPEPVKLIEPGMAFKRRVDEAVETPASELVSQQEVIVAPSVGENINSVLKKEAETGKVSETPVQASNARVDLIKSIVEKRRALSELSPETVETTPTGEAAPLRQLTEKQKERIAFEKQLVNELDSFMRERRGRKSGPEWGSETGALDISWLFDIKDFVAESAKLAGQDIRSYVSEKLGLDADKIMRSFRALKNIERPEVDFTQEKLKDRIAKLANEVPGEIQKAADSIGDGTFTSVLGQFMQKVQEIQPGLSIKVVNESVTRDTIANKETRSMAYRLQLKAMAEGKSVSKVLRELKLPEPVMENVASRIKEITRNTNYIGEGNERIVAIPPEQVGDADKVFRANEASRDAYKKELRVEGKKLWLNFRRQFRNAAESVSEGLKWDGSEEAFDALRAKTFMNNVSAESARFMAQLQSVIFNPLSKTERMVLDESMRAVRELELARVKSVRFAEARSKNTGLTLADYQAALDTIHAKYNLSKEQVEKINTSMNMIFSTFDELWTKMYDNGLITKRFFDKVQGIRYLKTQYFLENAEPLSFREKNALIDVTGIDESHTPGYFADIPTSVSEHGVQRISTGAKLNVNINTEQLLQRAIYHTDRKIAMNKANAMLAAYAEANPENVLGVRVPKQAVDAEGNLKFRKVSGDMQPVFEKMKASEGDWAKFSRIHFLDNGQVREIWLPKELVGEWSTNTSDVSPTTLSILSLLSGSSLVKATSTGVLAPLFFLANIPIDTAGIYSLVNFKGKDGKYESLYSANPFKFFKDYVSDIKEVLPDLINESGLYEEFVKRGGTQDFLTSKPALYDKVDIPGLHTAKSGLAVMRNYVTFMNRLSESMGRLAIMNRYLKENGERDASGNWSDASLDKASFTALEYMNYGKTGRATKLIDSVIPYFNAGSVGVNKVIDAFRENQSGTLMKAGVLSSISGMITAMNYMLFGDTYNQVSKEDKDRNMIIMTPFYQLDKNGEKQYYYIPIRKSLEFSIPQAMAELGVSVALGQKADSMRIMRAIGNFMPAGDYLPPLYAGLVGYSTNTDMLTGSKIVPDKYFNPEKPGHEVTSDPHNTNPFWRKFGEVTDLSPARSAYFMKSILGRNNEIANLLGAGIKEVFDDLPPAMQQSLSEKFINSGIPRRLIHVTNPRNEFMDDVKTVEAINKYDESAKKIKFETVVESYLSGQRTLDDVKKTIKENVRVPADIDRMINYVIEQKTLNNLPDKARWMAIKNAPSMQDRAQLFYDWYSKATPEKQAEMRKVAGKINLVTDSFAVEYGLVKKKAEAGK